MKRTIFLFLLFFVFLVGYGNDENQLVDNQDNTIPDISVIDLSYTDSQNNQIPSPWDISRKTATATSPSFDYFAKFDYEILSTFFQTFNFLPYFPPTSHPIDVSVNCPGIDFVVICFNLSNPSSYSDIKYSFVGDNNIIMHFTFPASGQFGMLIMPLGISTAYCDVTINNTTYANRRIFNSALTCFMPTTTGTEFNSFTWNSTRSMHLCVINNNGNVVAYNNAYTGTGDVVWGNEARAKINSTQGNMLLIPFITDDGTNMQHMHTSADIYAMCRSNFNHPNSFPDYEADDRIITDSISSDYNCLAWAIEDWTHWYWPTVFGNDITPGQQPGLAEFDAFLGNYGFTREGATEANSVLDLYSPYSIPTNFTHVAIKSRAHQFAAGYGWESKCGSWERVMHLRYALEGTPSPCYGSVIEHYKRMDNYVPQEYLDEVFLLSEEDGAQIERNVFSLSSETRNKFEDSFSAMEKDFYDSGIGNPNYVKGEPQFMNLCEFLENQPQAMCLVYEKVRQGNILSVPLLEELLVDEHKHVIALMGENIEKTRKTKDGKSIRHQILANANKFVSALLYIEKKGSLEGFSWPEEVVTSDDANAWDISLNGNRLLIDFALDYTSNVKICLTNLDGAICPMELYSGRLEKGDYHKEFEINGKGLFALNLFINGQVFTRKIYLK
jgi:hypothetical protein